MGEKQKKNNIVKRMILAVVAGFAVGFCLLLLREEVLNGGKSEIWKVIDAVFFSGYHSNKWNRRNRIILHSGTVVYERSADGNRTAGTDFSESCNVQSCKSRKAGKDCR